MSTMHDEDACDADVCDPLTSQFADLPMTDNQLPRNQFGNWDSSQPWHARARIETMTYDKPAILEISLAPPATS